MHRSSVIILIADFALALMMMHTARRRRTSERLVFGWLIVCAVIAALAIWREAIDVLAAALDVHYPPSALFLIAFAGLIAIVFKLSTELAEDRRRLRRLAQELALLSATAPGPQKDRDE